MITEKLALADGGGSCQLQMKLSTLCSFYCYDMCYDLTSKYLDLNQHNHTKQPIFLISNVYNRVNFECYVSLVFNHMSR